MRQNFVNMAIGIFRQIMPSKEDGHCPVPEMRASHLYIEIACPNNQQANIG
jgi:hypothetical protein